MIIIRLLLAMVILTQVDGSRLAVNPAEVVAISDPTPGHHKPGCRTVITVHDSRFCVRETFDEVLNKVGGDDGHH